MSTIDKEDRVFIFTEDKEVYVYNSNDGSVEKLEGIRKILSKRRYESVQAGWATCTQLRDVVLAIKLSNGEYKSEFDPNEVKNVERFEELVQQELEAGWATCTQLRDVVLAIKLSNGEYKSEFDPNEVKNVERFEELVQQELGI